VLLLICWKKGENFKRAIYSTCEYGILVRDLFSVGYFISLSRENTK